MQRLQSVAQGSKAKASTNAHGLTGHLVELIRRLRRRGASAEKQMHLVETLSLDGKRKLSLVECGGERFLIGGGLESVEIILQITEAQRPMPKRSGGACF